MTDLEYREARDALQGWLDWWNNWTEGEEPTDLEDPDIEGTERILGIK